MPFHPFAQPRWLSHLNRHYPCMEGRHHLRNARAANQEAPEVFGSRGAGERPRDGAKAQM